MREGGSDVRRQGRATKATTCTGLPPSTTPHATEAAMCTGLHPPTFPTLQHSLLLAALLVCVVANGQH